MAQAFWESLGGGQWEVKSAGARPSGYVHPLAIRAMRELDIDISANVSTSIGRFQHEAFDLVVTVCDNAREACPVFPGAQAQLHWPFDDPAVVTGTEEEQMIAFRHVRDAIKDTIDAFLADGSGPVRPAG
jgi:arsenate reductase (thioredoxin)